MDETLQDKITRLSNELDALEQKGITTEEDINLRNQLINEKSQAEYDLAQQEKIEEKVQAEAVPFAVAGISLEGVPVEVIKLVEAVVKADRRHFFGQHAKEIQQLETDCDLHINGLEAENDDLKNQVFARDALLAIANGNVERLTAENHQLAQEKTDVESKRDAAVAQLEESKRDAQSLNDSLNEEIRRLQSEIEDYQKAKVFGEREAQGITDVTPDEQNDIANALENVKKLYKSVEDWGSVLKVNKPDGTYELAKRAEVEADWAPIEAPEIGGSESGKSFLGQDQTPADNGDTQAAAEAPEVVEDAPFQNESESAVDGLAETTSTVDREPYVTWEAFESLERAVDELYARTRKVEDKVA